MKRIFLIISLLSVFMTNGNAQNKNVLFGLKIGPNLNWVSTKSTAGNNLGVQLGYHAGLIMDYRLTNNFYVSSGVNFNYLRLKYQFTDYRLVPNFLEYTNVCVDRKFQGYYFEIPLKIKAKTEILDSWKPFVEAGVSLSINNKAKAMDSYDFHGISIAEETYSDHSNQYRLLQGAIVFGVGTEYVINRNLSFFAQATFDHSLSNTFISTLAKQTGSDLNTNFVGLEVGILF